MNGFRKSKGIVIELTALLDVILIMLFWVMLNMQTQSENVKSDADSRVEQAESRIEEQEKAYNEQLESIQAEADSRVAEAWAEAESIDSNGVKNQQALDEYKQGLSVTLNLSYGDESGIYISKGGEDIGFCEISSQEAVADGIISALESAGLEKTDVVLCTLVYDGDTALYRDVKRITSAVEEVERVYEGFYCAYINTTGQKGR